mmetsp:Transcript_11757/g.21394  ORF Transcript_11757/g.21394 Transcript_11757/m.21394 type:complete len:683 (+) Transcript_11757:86-2134(+)
MDLSLKPSLARYEMRPEKLVPTKKPEATKDEALLEMVERQANIAHMKMMCGEPRQACMVLRRAFLEADAYTKSQMPAPPAGRLALAAIRVNICIVLSRVGQHERALQEAQGAALELEDMWHTMITASAEDEVAVRNGDVLRRFDPVIVLLRRPPTWLAKAVEVCVQVKQCTALELEYKIRGSPASSSSGPVRPASSSLEMLEKTWLEIEQLHKEGLALARDLLPERHEVRDRAEKCLLEVRIRFHKWCQEKRRELRLSDRTGPATSSATSKALPTGGAEAHDESSQAAAIEKESEENGMHGNVPEAPQEAALDSGAALPPQESEEVHVDLVELPELLRILDTKIRLPVQSRRESDGTGPSPSNPNAGSNTPGGALAPSAAPEADATQETTSPDMTTSDFHATAPQPPGHASLTWTSGFDKQKDAREKDPFSEWRRTAAHRDMNFLQRTVRRDEGLNQLREDLKRKSGFFKQVWIKDLEATDPDRLFDNRTLYNLSSVRLREKVHDRMERAQTPPDEEELRRLRHAEIDRDRLFKYYGVSYSGSEPSFGAYVKLMSTASPAEQERLHEEEQLRKRREFAESMRRQAEQERMMAKLQVSKSGVLTASTEGGVFGYLGQLAQQSFERHRLESAEKKGVRASVAASKRANHDTANGPRFPGKRMTLAMRMQHERGSILKGNQRRHS